MSKNIAAGSDGFGGHLFGVAEQHQRIVGGKQRIRHASESGAEAAARGNAVSPPIPLAGIEVIQGFTRMSGSFNPRPLIVLIDELTLSTGEYVASILQQLPETTLIGSSTGGALGFIKSISVEDISEKTFGMSRLTFTSVLRHDGLKYVEPDISYDMTVEDLLTGYQPFQERILSIIRERLGCQK